MALQMSMRAFGGVRALAPSVRASPVPFSSRAPVVVVQAADRLRMDNLSPAKGSRKLEKRKGRGYGQGQGGTCGFGNRGQKSRSGPGVRSGFEGGQMPLYRRLPKLRGIAGGMGAGLPDFVVVNLKDLEKHFEAGAEVSLESVKEKVLSVSGREAKLPLKILGSGKLTKGLTVKATAFSESAKAAIEAAGGKVEIVAVKAKWTRYRYNKLKKTLAEAGKDYTQEMLAKKVAKLVAKGRVNKLRLNKKPKVKNAPKAKSA